MKPSAIRYRALLLLLILTNAVWLCFLGRVLGSICGHATGQSRYHIALIFLTVTVLIRCFVMSRWMATVRNARLGYVRSFVVLEAVGGAALLFGLIRGYAVQD